MENPGADGPFTFDDMEITLMSRCTDPARFNPLIVTFLWMLVVKQG